MNNNESTKLRINNAQSSDQLSSKYNNCYILNNLNNYQPNVILGNKTKTKSNNNNKSKNNEKIKNINNANNSSNNNSDNNSKKTNDPPNNNNNDNENNSLIRSTENCLNTIGFSLSNNISNENSLQTGNCIKFNGLSGNVFNPLSYSNNKSINMIFLLLIRGIKFQKNSKIKIIIISKALKKKLIY